MKRIIPFLLCALFSWTTAAQLPTSTLSSIHPAGARIGTTTDVSASGSDLDEANQLLFSHPGITASHKEGTRFSVTISPDVPPGTYEARLHGHFGISNPRSFVAGQLDHHLEQGDPHTIENASPLALESVLFGRTEPNAVDHFKVQLQKNQRILIECLDREIDSRMDSSLALLDPAGKEIARSRSGGLLDFTPHTGGEYILQVYDFTYRGGVDYFYRLSINTLAHIDFILPPTALPGTTNRHTLYGRNLPAGQAVDDMTLSGQPLQKLIVEIEAPADPGQPHPRSILRQPHQSSLSGFEYRLKTARGLSNPIFIGFATAPVILEDRSNDQPDLAQIISLPCEYTGQFWPARDQDWIRFTAKKDEAYIIELFSHRLGTPSSPFALLQKISRSEDGTLTASDIKEIAASDTNVGGTGFKTLTRDPSWRFAVKEDGDYRIQLVDLFNQAESHPGLVYRLALRQERPGFRLVALSHSQSKDRKKLHSEGIVARRGQTVPIELIALREDGFAGPIEVSPHHLPTGITCNPATLDNNANSTTLLLTVAPDAPAWNGELQLTATATINGQVVTQPVLSAGVTWSINDTGNEYVQSRLTDRLAAAICDEPTPISLQPPASLETSVAGKIKFPVKVTRNAPFNEQLKIKPAGHSALDKAREIEIDGKAESGEYELDLATTKLGPGTYQFHFQTETKGKYRNDPEAVDEASAMAKAARNTLEDVKKEAAAAAEEKTKSEAAAAAAAEEARKAEAAVNAAEQAIKDAEARLAESIKAKETAIATRETAATAKTAAEENARRAAETAAGIAAKVPPAETAKEEAEKQAKAAEEKSKPRDLTIPVYSQPFTLTVTPAPVTLPPEPASASLTQGTRLQIPIRITRLYDYKDPVELHLVLPKDLKGITAAHATIENESSEATLTIEASKEAAPGGLTATLEARLKLNGQDLQVSRPITITVIKTPEETAPAETATKQ